MQDTKITEDIKYIGVDDKTIDLFEGQYIVPNGISYNSYLIKYEKNVVMDTVDRRAGEEWFKNLETELNGEKVEYLVISHLEPDHAANIERLANKYQEMKLIGNAVTFKMLTQFFEIKNLEERKIVVKEAEEINIGKHTLQFFMAPMVHWPEVMVTYEKTEKILFTADGFGKFGTLDTEEDWACEARRYYFNIVGKYGMQVQALLKKAATLDIKMICPLHGPILKENLAYYINKYDIWSSYKPEDKGIFIAYASIHGYTAKAVEKLVEILKQKGVEKIAVSDLTRYDMAEAVEDAFRYGKLVLATTTYNADIFPTMKVFIDALIERNYQKKKLAFIENGSWGPMANKIMKAMFEKCKDITYLDTNITILSSISDKNIAEIDSLAAELLK